MKKAKKELTAEDRLRIVQFIDDMNRLTHNVSDKSKLISIKVPENLLRSFKFRCEEKGLKYQSHIKNLMWDWLEKSEP